MMRRIRESKTRRLLLQGAIAAAVIFGVATQLAAPAVAASDDWWRYHRFGDSHRTYDRHYDRGRYYAYSGPRYYYAPPTYNYPPPPPTYYYAPPAPGFSFGIHI